MCVHVCVCVYVLSRLGGVAIPGTRDDEMEGPAVMRTKEVRGQ